MSNDSSLSKSQLDLLKQFKKQMNKATPQPVHQSQKSPILSDPQTADNEEMLFKQAMQGVTPISNKNMIPHKVIKRPIDAQILAKRMAAEGAPESLSESSEISDTQALLNPVSSQTFLSYRVATLQHRVFDDLKAGKLPWFEAVDLHGCTMEQAREAVLQVIQIAQDHQKTVIKIVHGKGETGILKTCVNGWLRQHKQVLAFVSAPENQGGTGAVLVLIKRSFIEKNQQQIARTHHK